MANSSKDGENTVTPISEWPIDADIQSQLQVDGIKDIHNKTIKRSFHCDRQLYHFKTSKKIRNSVDNHNNRKYQHLTDIEVKEPMVQTRVAKWWRKNQQYFDRKSLPNSTNPNTVLFCVSRKAECQVFLQEEEKKLKCKIRNNGRDTADVFAALASVQDWLGHVDIALDNINKAIELDSSPQFVWLMEKLSKQKKMFQIQSEKLSSLGKTSEFPRISEVDRVFVKDLTKEDFISKYVKTHTPVILLDLVKVMTTSPWTLQSIKQLAGKKKVQLKKLVPMSAEWACLEESKSDTVERFINAVEMEETEDYLFDWSLPLHCPELNEILNIPSFFEDNYLCQTSPGSLYHDSWPSLFVAPAGAVSQLHVDAFASSFWMALFQGQKRWTFFPPSDTALLYPVFSHSMDPVFKVDLQKPDVKSYPLLTLTQPSQCILRPGELLYVPSGSAHFVENLTASLAVSSNYVDASNYSQVCEELRINGLVDPRAAELLEQLYGQKFTDKINSQIFDIPGKTVITKTDYKT